MTTMDEIEIVPPETESSGRALVDEPQPHSGPATFISPRIVAVVWFISLSIASWINPATTEPIQATTTLTVLANVGAIAWFATLFAGAARFGRTAKIGLATGGLMLTGHLICGIDGHLPMTGSIWITQLMLIAAATAVSGLALATRR